MKKTYKVEVDCPVCAQKLEDCVSKIDGVESCTVNFLTQKMSINAEKEEQNRIINEAIAQMKKIDDDVVITA